MFNTTVIAPFSIFLVLPFYYLIKPYAKYERCSFSGKYNILATLLFMLTLNSIYLFTYSVLHWYFDSKWPEIGSLLIISCIMLPIMSAYYYSTYATESFDFTWSGIGKREIHLSPQYTRYFRKLAKEMNSSNKERVLGRSLISRFEKELPLLIEDKSIHTVTATSHLLGINDRCDQLIRHVEAMGYQAKELPGNSLNKVLIKLFLPILTRKFKSWRYEVKTVVITINQ